MPQWVKDKGYEAKYRAVQTLPSDVYEKRWTHLKKQKALGKDYCLNCGQDGHRWTRCDNNTKKVAAAKRKRNDDDSNKPAKRVAAVQIQDDTPGYIVGEVDSDGDTPMFQFGE